MTCCKIKDGWLCMDDDFVNLEPYGARVWMSWHHYCGPTFYRSKAALKPIISPSKKTWDAFARWMEKKNGGGDGDN